MGDQEHNGWANYATWRVQLEYFADRDLQFFTGGRLYGFIELCELLKEHMETLIEETTEPYGVARGFALAFIDDVRWPEIANHLVDADDDGEDADDEEGEDE